MPARSSQRSRRRAGLGRGRQDLSRQPPHLRSRQGVPPRAAALRRPADAPGQDPVRLHRLRGSGGRRRRLLSRRAEAYAPELAKRLGFYKLRAKVAVEDRSEALAVVAGWGDAPRPADEVGLVAEDPRLAALGWRAIVAAEDVPEFARGDASRLSRPPHRPRRAGGRTRLPLRRRLPARGPDGPARRRRFRQGLLCGPGGRLAHAASRHRPHADRAGDLPEGIAAEAGVEVTAGDRVLGKTGTAANGRGLAMIRLDRADDALAAGETIRAGGLPVRIVKPDWIRFPFPGEATAARPRDERRSTWRSGRGSSGKRQRDPRPRVRTPPIGLIATGLRRRRFPQEVVDVETPGDHGEVSIRRPRPAFPRAVPVQLDAVLVRIAQVQGLAHAVIAKRRRGGSRPAKTRRRASASAARVG